MITGGTSPWPVWGLLLTGAIALSVVAFFVAIYVYRTKGFQEASKRRTVLFALTAMCLVTWVGYQVASNARWHAGSIASEVHDIVSEDTYGNSPRKLVSDICDGSALAFRFSLRVDTDANLEGLSLDVLLERLVELQAIEGRLLEAGFMPRWQLEGEQEGRWLAVEAVRGQERSFTDFRAGLATTQAIPAPAASCPFSSDQFRLGFVDELTVEALCAVGTGTEHFPLVC